VPFENIKKMGELGFLGLTVSEEYGGAALDTVSYCVAIEEISKACAATAIVMAVRNSLVCYGIEKLGTEEQKQRFLVPLAKGKLIGAFALTEPGAGCDGAAQETTMVLDGDEYIVDGTKNFITNGGFADVIVLFGMTDKSQGYRGTTRFWSRRTRLGSRWARKRKSWASAPRAPAGWYLRIVECLSPTDWERRARALRSP